ncbi:MAG TPA: N-acetylmuramoyl-L-alanine amidase [Burkholderiaceae bacterium]|nr:N-acetylmuramoyl-L-alanine amidase [Burkholderiaceae bacterium]
MSRSARHDVSDDTLFKRRRLLQAAGATLLLPLAAPNAQAATVSAVRVWPAQDYTRVTLEHDNELKFTHFVVDNPPRLVVDIDGIELNATLRDLVAKITPNDPYINAVRVGQNRPRVVRLVIDLKQAVNPQVFSLEPVAQFRHRLIFDLYPLVAPDPLLSLLPKTEVVVTPATPPAEPDPIAELARSLPGGKVDSDAPAESAPTAKPHKSEPARDAANSTTEVASIRPRSTRKPLVSRLVTIAIDPGHGGEDPGAMGRRGSREKDVVMRIAARVKAKLDNETNMRAMLTRDGDYFVPLHVRVQKARRVQADLFVSIHADAFVNTSANGSSVFVLSERGATSTAAGWLAKKENDADLIGGVNIDTRDKMLARVLLDLSTTAQINDSLKLGRSVLDHIGRLNRLHKPHVEQAGFAVLKAPDIPSILVETAFISNPEEERRLNDAAFQEKMAEAIVTGIKRYFANNPPLAKSRVARLHAHESNLL